MGLSAPNRRLPFASDFSLQTQVSQGISRVGISFARLIAETVAVCRRQCVATLGCSSGQEGVARHRASACSVAAAIPPQYRPIWRATSALKHLRAILTILCIILMEPPFFVCVWRPHTPSQHQAPAGCFFSTTRVVLKSQGRRGLGKKIACY